MRRFSHRLNPLTWPIRVKLVGSLLLVVLVPTLLLWNALQPGIRDANIRNLTIFATENGERQRLALSNSLNRARTDLNIFLTSDVRRLTLVNALLGTRSLQRDTEAEAAAVLRAALLEPATTTPYHSVRLVTPDGQLLAAAAADATASPQPAADQTGTAAFRAIEAEQVTDQPRDQLIVVSERDGAPVVELANAFIWRDDEPIGYIIAELNTTRVFYDQLAFNNTVEAAYSYLTSRDGVPLVPPDLEQRDTILAGSSLGAGRARRGDTGVSVYTLSVTDTEVVGYYAPLPNTPLGLVVEIPTQAALAATRALFNTRLFLVGLTTLALILLVAALLNQVMATPLVQLRRAAEGVTRGDYAQPVDSSQRDDEIGQLAATFVEMRQQVQSLVNDLEARVAARARDLDATHDISRFAAQQSDINRLMQQVVNLIVQRFESIYHAQIFLLNNERTEAVLRASTGEAGQQLLANQHRLPVGSPSVIGQVTGSGQVVVARDTAASAIHRHNEFLPDTRAELAIPLRVGDAIIGALDVQSQQRDAFSDDLISILQTMADQIAIALQNARLYAESMQRMLALEHSTRADTLAAWRDYIRAERTNELVGAAGSPTTTFDADLRARALQLGQPVVGEPDAAGNVPVVVPVTLRGQTLGVVEWAVRAADLNQNRLRLAQELANRLAVSLDNTRLLHNSRSLANRERVVGDIAARLAQQTDINEILQTAVEEVGQVLGAPHVSIRLHSADNGTSNGSGNGSGSGASHTPANGNGRNEN